GNVGVSFAVFHKGEIVLAGGSGYRDLENQKPAVADTLYNIASCTKAFTAIVCVLLARDGGLALDVPAKTYLPEPLDGEITLVDMMSHRTGYARLDPSWLGADGQLLVCNDDLLTRVNRLPHAKPLRSVWMYNNWMYALVGEIIKRKGSHGSWEGFMEQEILPRFNMPRSCVCKDQLLDDNITRSYASTLSRQAMLVPDPPWEESPFAAGSGIRSSVKDMMKWASFLLESYTSERDGGGRGTQSGQKKRLDIPE
ncbi:beta-lactamase/transpeptidase-like protein, partial [Leptodontidium sp. 2 PMI_412]